MILLLLSSLKFNNLFLFLDLMTKIKQGTLFSYIFIMNYDLETGYLNNCRRINSDLTRAPMDLILMIIFFFLEVLYKLIFWFYVMFYAFCISRKICIIVHIYIKIHTFTRHLS